MPLAPDVRRLWFDVTTVVDRNISTATAALVAQRIRQVGVERILYGSDAAVGDNLRDYSARSLDRCAHSG